MTVVAQIVKWNARNRAAREDLRKIMQILRGEEALLRCRYVMSAENPSDYFSRVPSKGEWVLHQSVVDRFIDLFEPCTVDRFADRESSRLPRFNSPYPCLGCEAVDAFTVSWAGECS